MKFCRFFSLAVLYSVLTCSCDADYITMKQEKDSSLLYTYCTDFDENVCSLVLKPPVSSSDVYTIDRITLAGGYDISYIRSLLFNVINSYQLAKFSIHISGDSSSSFRDANSDILDEGISEICRSLGFEIKVDRDKKHRQDVFQANSVESNKHRYVTSRWGVFFKHKPKLRNDDIPEVEIKNIV